MPANSFFLVRAGFILAAIFSLLGCVANRSDDGLGDAVVASIGDYHITESELDAAWQERAPAEYARTRHDTFRLRRRVLDELVAEYLLRQKIDHLNLTAEDLVARAIESGAIPSIAPVDESEVVELYEQSVAADYDISFNQLRAALVDTLHDDRFQKAREQYLHLLRRDADIRIFMAIPRVSIPVTKEDPARGFPDAPIQLVEFSDFHCPFCRELRSTLERLMTRYGDDLQWVWKDYPLASLTAAAAARCAHDQGMFWEYHDGLFERQPELQPRDLDGVEALQALAADVGLDGRVFADCVSTGRYEDVVAEAAEAAYLLGISGTPTVFINGRMVAGAERFETYEQILLEELQLLEQGRSD